MFPKIDRILFASDLSDNSKHAFQYASSLASRFGASIVLLHVLENLPSGVSYNIETILGEGAVHRIREKQKEDVRDVLIGKRKDDEMVRVALADYYGGEAGAASNFEVEICEGDVDDEVARVASEKGCDVIVIGSHKGLLGGTALSGVTKSVLRHTKIPVLVVPPLVEG